MRIIKEVKISIPIATLLSVVITAPIIAVFVIVYANVFGWDALRYGWDIIQGNKLISFSVLVIGVIIHELVHGITWAYFCELGFKSIKFGVKWKYLTPYAHCKELLPVNWFKCGVIMPLFLVGVLPAVIGLLTANVLVFYFGLIFILSAGGDIIGLMNLMPFVGNYFVKDNPDEFAFNVYLKEH